MAVLAMTLSQKTTFKYDVLVIDSGSSDIALDYVRRMAEENVLYLKEISKKDFGHGKTRNLGIEMTNSEFVAFLTQDALPVNKYWLQNLVNPMMENDEIAGVFGRHYSYPASGRKMHHDLESFMQGFDRGPQVVRISDWDDYHSSLSTQQFMHYYSDNNSCLRRSVWKEIPYQDVNYGEDQIWAKEIIEAGYSKAYAKDAAVYHSHMYGVIETYKRSRIDRYFWVSSFGYISVQNLWQVFCTSWEQYISEKKWHLEHQIELSLFESVEIFIKKLATFYGEYRGFLDAR